MASELIVQTLKGPTSGANANKVIIPSGQTLTAPGHVIQVVNVESSTATVRSGSTTYDFDVMSATITPSSTSSKILISGSVFYSQSNTGSAADFGFYFKRNSTRIGGVTNDAARGGSNVWYASDEGFDSSNVGGWGGLNAAYTYLDSPSTTDKITYYIGCQTGNSIAVNRFYSGSNGGTSQLTLMEIAG